MIVKTFRHLAGDIDWHCQTQGEGPTVVLVPSGEGDCESFTATMNALADRFSVLTFDTPGFSRTSAPANPSHISIGRLADQIATLVRSLGLKRVSFYGCSSGGRAVLDLARHHPDLVMNAIVHEAALAGPVVAQLEQQLLSLDDSDVVGACQYLFANMMNEDPALWAALGTDYHHRLQANYLTWVRRYIANGPGEPIDPGSLLGKPITWTIGALTPPGLMDNNVALGRAADIAVDTLPCMHFPQVSIPERLADHISETINAHMNQALSA